MAWSNEEISQFQIDKKAAVSGIYKITSPSGRIYIGKSINIFQRFKHHRCNPQKKKSRRPHIEPILTNSFIKYGVENHLFEIIIECQVDELSYWEIYYISMFNTYKTSNGMNCTAGGDGATKGFKMTDEVKKKIGDAQRGEKNHQWGKRLSELEKEKLRNYAIGNKSQLGQKQSAETIAKRVLKIKGKKRTIETLERMRVAQTGKVMSSESRKKMSEAQKGKIVSEQTRKKISISNIGHVVSNETRKKIGNANRGRKYSDEVSVRICRIILNTETGIFYFGTKAASDSIGMKMQTLRSKLSGRIRNNTSFIYA